MIEYITNNFIVDSTKMVSSKVLVPDKLFYASDRLIDTMTKVVLDSVDDNRKEELERLKYQTGFDRDELDSIVKQYLPNGISKVVAKMVEDYKFGVNISEELSKNIDKGISIIDGELQICDSGSGLFIDDSLGKPLRIEKILKNENGIIIFPGKINISEDRMRRAFGNCKDSVIMLEYTVGDEFALFDINNNKIKYFGNYDV